MKKINLTRLKQFVKLFLSIFTYRDILLFVCAPILVVLAICLTSCPWWIHVLAVISAVLVLLRLPLSNIMLNPVHSLGWAFVDYAVFITVCSCLRIHNADVGMDQYAMAVLSLVVIEMVIYSVVIPKVSYWLKFTDEKGYNGTLACLVIYTVLIIPVFMHEENVKNDLLFEREPFVKVTKWDKEVNYNRTYYIVWCSKGTFSISPSEYPEIRNINSNTQIRVLRSPYHNTSSGTNAYDRLEIKNH